MMNHLDPEVVAIILVMVVAMLMVGLKEVVTDIIRWRRDQKEQRQARAEARERHLVNHSTVYAGRKFR